MRHSVSEPKRRYGIPTVTPSNDGVKYKGTTRNSAISLTNRTTRLEISPSKNTVTLKLRLQVTEDHWKCHHLIQRMRLPINV